MKIGLFTPLAAELASPELAIEVAGVAEECGFSSLWVPEHAVLFDQYAPNYPYSEDGRMPGGASANVLDPFPVLSFFAAHTKRIRIGTGVMILPQRNPIYAAKEIASLDVLSGGRLDVGIGVGWLEEEMRALGTPWEHRGARTNSYVSVMKTLWLEDPSAYEDEFYSLPACRFAPKPVQKPHPPLIFGGESRPALRRIAELGQGWNAAMKTPEQMATLLAELDVLLAENGRSRSELEVTVMPGTELGSDDLAAYRDVGVDQVVALGAAPSAEAVRSVFEPIAKALVVPASAM
ncbi:MAG: LLM class F420-dependent oxidoreductase [Gemmatimonadetes bacterium]|nr:LLM class F420-dependent oxidoreductase [Gemmatimonadota bacterium]